MSIDDVSITVATVSTLFRLFSFISDEFLCETSCVRKIIFLAFCTYVEHPKHSSDAILVFFIMNVTRSH
jgi:hypothetical protein